MILLLLIAEQSVINYKTIEELSLMYSELGK